MKSSPFIRLALLCSFVSALAGCASGSDEGLGGGSLVETGSVDDAEASIGSRAQVTLSRPVLRAAAADKRIVRDVLLELEKANRSRVIVTFDVPELAAAGALTFGTRERAVAQSAIKNFSGHLLSQVGPLEVRHRFTTLNAVAITIDESAIPKLISEPKVLSVVPDHGGSGHLAQALPLSRLLAVHSQGLRGAGVTVAVLDSGVDVSHPDIAGSLVSEACFCSGNNGCCPPDQNGIPRLQAVGPGSAVDDHGHGSNVAGIIVSDGNVAPLGGAPDSKLVAVKVLDSNNAFMSSSDVIAGFEWIIQNQPNVKIVNASLGTHALFNGSCDNEAVAQPWKVVIDTLRNNNVLVFASSGNQSSGTALPLPACLTNTFSVGAVWDSNVGSISIFNCTEATTQADKVACFTNSNSQLDLMAPGAPMTSVGLGGGISTFFGTSQASPLVASCAALLLQSKPNLTASQLESALKASTVKVVDAKNGLTFPRLDCDQALDIVGGPTCVPDCRDRVCGMDGCGGSCGTCGAGQACTDAGQCELANNCTAPEWKYETIYTQGMKVSYAGYEYEAAYWTRAQNPATNNGAIGSGQPWKTPTLCGPCVPDCTGKSCGSDNCGGICGECTENAMCSEIGQCLADASCTGVPNWQLGKRYSGGEVVQSNGSRYQCKPWAASEWCGLATEYQPGVGRAWRDAWDEAGRCSENTASGPLSRH